MVTINADTRAGSMAMEPVDRLRVRHWAIATGVLAVLVAGFVALFWGAVTGAIRVWIASPTYNHCFLIIPISAWLIWERRGVFARLSPRPFFPALILIPMGSVAWLVAASASVLEIQQFALLGMIQVSFLAVLGWSVYRALMFPLLYLFFLVPSGDFLVPWLQDIAAAFAVAGLQVLEIPVYSDGIFLMIPNGRFEVAEACAGLRFLIASIAFGFLFANLIYRSFRKRAIFVALSIIVPVIANGFRVIGIILLAHYTDNRIAVGADHLVYGWGFFTFVLLILIVVGLRFREDVGPAPLPEPEQPRRGAEPGLVAAGAMALVLAGIGPGWAAYVDSLPATADLAALRAPRAEAPWRAIEDGRSDWEPVYATADATLRQAYTDGERVVELFVAYYQRQRDGAELIAFQNRVYDGEIWSRSGGGRAVVVVDGITETVATTNLVRGDRRRVVAHWHWIGGEATASRLEAKILQAKGELLTGQRAAAKVAFSIEDGESRRQGLDAIRDLLAHLEPVGPVLDRVAAGGSD